MGHEVHSRDPYVLHDSIRIIVTAVAPYTQAFKQLSESIQLGGTAHVWHYQISSPEAQAKALNLVRELKQGGNPARIIVVRLASAPRDWPWQSLREKDLEASRVQWSDVPFSTLL
ncbi:hypothetical protein CCMA1212_001154 [Trichoderma ghanense]|uniref:Uncharacterized protein n=1 Tax=Trichoderma ghanense TaxID=65468 RepID=A0ABY2HHS8_9HYPO